MLGKRLYIDALALVPSKKSGVGQTVEQLTKHLSNFLAEEGWEIYLLVPLGKAGYLREYEKPNVKIKTIYLPARGIKLLLSLRLLPPLDIFLGSGIYLFPNYRNWPLLRSRSLTYIYDIGFILFPNTLQPKNKKYLTDNIQKWLKRTDLIITISQQVKNEIIKYLYVPKKNVAVVYCGVNRTLFYPRSHQEVLEVKAQYGIYYEKYILFVGNIEPRKNLSVLIDAFCKLPKQIQAQYGLVIVGGDGWLNKILLERIETEQKNGRNIQRVRNYVTSDHLPAIYSGASLLVHPAIYEGFGMTPLEALASGLRVLAADIPAVREILKEDAEYFDPYSVAELRDKVVDMLKSSQRKKVISRRVTDLSWEKSAQALFECINDLYHQGYKDTSLKACLKNAVKKLDGYVYHVLDSSHNELSRASVIDNKRELLMNIYDSLLPNESSAAKKFLLNWYEQFKRFILRGARLIQRRLRKG